VKLKIKFKDPDMIGDYINSAVPGDYEDPKVEAAREKIADKYFEWGDYGAVEVDTETGEGRLVPIKEWGRWT
jgi:hypothetical protein